MPASDDSIHCCATENSMNGAAIQITPSSATSGQSPRVDRPARAGHEGERDRPEEHAQEGHETGLEVVEPQLDEQEGGAPGERHAREQRPVERLEGLRARRGRSRPGLGAGAHCASLTSSCTSRSFSTTAGASTNG